MRTFAVRAKQPLENLTNSDHDQDTVSMVTFQDGFAKTILQGAVKGKEEDEVDRKRVGMTIITMWTVMDLAS